MSTAFTDETRECEGTGVATWCLWLKAWPLSSPVYRKGHSEIGDLWTSQTASSFLGTNPKHQCFFLCFQPFHLPLTFARRWGTCQQQSRYLATAYTGPSKIKSTSLIEGKSLAINWPKHLHFHQELTSLFAMYAKNPLIRVVVAWVVHHWTKIQWTFKVFQLCYANFRSFSHF